MQMGFLLLVLLLIRRRIERERQEYPLSIFKGVLLRQKVSPNPAKYLLWSIDTLSIGWLGERKIFKFSTSRDRKLDSKVFNCCTVHRFFKISFKRIFAFPFLLLEILRESPSEFQERGFSRISLFLSVYKIF